MIRHLEQGMLIGESRGSLIERIREGHETGGQHQTNMEQAVADSFRSPGARRKGGLYPAYHALDAPFSGPADSG
jgi:hypothetical protein